MKRNNRSSDPVREDRKRNDAMNKSESDNEKDLPGNYPPKEDIMNRMNTKRVGIDVENFSRVVGPENYNKENEPVVSNPNDVLNEPDLNNPDLDAIDDVEEPPREMERPVPKNLDLNEDATDLAAGNESDVTKEDLQALGPKDLSMDMGEDEQVLKNRVWPVDMSGDDLDVPGSELDDKNESIGSEDEENNPYSIGGDRNEDRLEGK